MVLEMTRTTERERFLWKRNVSYSYEFGDIAAGNSWKIEIPPATLKQSNSSNTTVYLAWHLVNISQQEELEKAPELIAKVDKIEGII